MAISVGKLRGSPRPEENADALDGLDTEEREAFNRFYREFVPRVAGYVRRHIHDHELIDEIVQETLLRAYRHSLHLEEGDEHWRWLATVARNLCIDQRALHRNWRESSVEEPETLDLTVYDADPEAHVVAAERQEIVARALERLTERERRLLVQKHIEGRRVREMANHEGVHVEALKSALRRARKAFAESYAAVTDRTGVASVFGPLVAGASLRLRELKARIGAMGDQVTTLAAHATTSSGFLNATTAAVVASLALGPGLGTLLQEAEAGLDGRGRSEELTFDGSAAPVTPTLAASSRSADSTLGGSEWTPRNGLGGAAPASGSGDGATSSADEPSGDPGPEVPGGPPIGASGPEPEPVDVGEEEVEEPEDARFSGFAYAPGSEESTASDSDGDSDSREAGASSGAPEREGSADRSGDASADEPATGDSGSNQADDSGTSDGSDAPDGADGDDSPGTDRGPADDDVPDDEPEGESDEPAESHETHSEDGDGSPDPNANASGAGNGEVTEGDGVSEVFALGEPLPEKRGECEIQCSVLFRSTDGGTTWQKLPAKGLEADEIRLSPAYPHDPRIFAVGRLGLMVSGDGGHTFWPTATPMVLASGGWRVVFDFWPGFGRDGEDRVVIGGIDGAWLYYADTGVVERVPTRVARVGDVTAVPRHRGEPEGVLIRGPGNVVEFCSGVGLCEPVTTVAGPTAFSNLVFIESGAAGDRRPDHGGVFLAWGDWGDVATSVRRSDDSGQSFERRGPRVSHLSVYSPNMLYGGSVDWPRVTDGSTPKHLTLYESHDTGQTWSRVSHARIPGNATSVMESLAPDRWLIADYDGGIWCFDTGEASWARRCAPSPSPDA